jgi:nucleoside diphosphate kinase
MRISCTTRSHLQLLSTHQKAS